MRRITRRSTRQRKSVSFGPDFVALLLENEPQTFKASMSSCESTYWKVAVNREIESILSNHTQKLTDLPPGNKPLGSKWIFKRKMKPDGTIDKYKAGSQRVRTKGRYGLLCHIFSSNKDNINQDVNSTSSMHDLKIHQMDVNTTFLNGELEEEIYMEQP